jgi:hypothetical protein
MSDPPWNMVIPKRVSTDPRRHRGHAALLSVNQGLTLKEAVSANPKTLEIVEGYDK